MTYLSYYLSNYYRLRFDDYIADCACDCAVFQERSHIRNMLRLYLLPNSLTL